MYARRCVFDGRGRGKESTLGIKNGSYFIDGYITDPSQYFCMSNVLGKETIHVYRGADGSAIILCMSEREPPFLDDPALKLNEFYSSHRHDPCCRAIYDMAGILSNGWQNIDNPSITEEGLLALPSPPAIRSVPVSKTE